MVAKLLFLVFTCGFVYELPLDMLPCGLTSNAPCAWEAQVLATDGVWDVMDNEEVISIVGRYMEAPRAGVSPASALTLEAMYRWKSRAGRVRLSSCCSITPLLACITSSTTPSSSGLATHYCCY
jgi:hypothetical protein